MTAPQEAQGDRIMDIQKVDIQKLSRALMPDDGEQQNKILDALQSIQGLADRRPVEAADIDDVLNPLGLNYNTILRYLKQKE
jgi:hypothetical protein